MQEALRGHFAVNYIIISIFYKEIDSAKSCILRFSLGPAGLEL